MEQEIMDLDQLASFLQRDVREVSKMANRGYLPGHKVGGQWRFSSAEIHYWVETQLHAYSETELAALEAGAGEVGDTQEPLVTALLSEATMAVPLAAATRASVLKELVNLAEQSWQVYDPNAVLEAVKKRETQASTALESGIAIPHPSRVLPETVIGEPVIAFARTASGIPFGAPNRQLTDMFFLLLCTNQAMHLRTLARLARMMLRPNFAEDLRAAETIEATWKVLETAEREVIDLAD